MGGNALVINKKTGEQTKAEKIHIDTIGRSNFIDTLVELFKKMNEEFKELFDRPIWINEEIITNGVAFNGSTSFIMDPSFLNEDVIKFKSTAGDVDITVPEELRENLWSYLDSIEGDQIIPGVTYKGSNKPTLSSIGEQINSIFSIKFKNGETVNAQVDFEFLPFEDDVPTEWSKFSHSSSFDDVREGIKAVNHKYLIRALVGGASIRDDIVVVTPSSTPEKLRFKKINESPRMLKFSIVRGIRLAYEPLLDDGKEVLHEGKPIYREILPKNSTYITDVKEICDLSFQSDVKEKELFESFIGVIKLMKMYLTEEQIQETHDRYIELLWGMKDRAQELEAGNPELDREIKLSGYKYLVNELNLKDESDKFMTEYYNEYGHRNSFRKYLALEGK